MSDVSPLIKLPCDCVVEVLFLESIDIDDVEHVLCPWCEALFFAAELETWVFGSGLHPVVLGNGPLLLVKFGEKVLEFVGFCGDCKTPLMRKCGSDKVEHLELPVEEGEPLRN